MSDRYSRRPWKTKLHPVPHHQRPYVASHPLGLLFSIGVTVQGAMYLLAPGIFQTSASVAVLSQAVLYIFNATWLLGGGLSTFGIARGHRKPETVGMSLLGGGFAAYYSIIAQAVPYGWATGLFIGFLAAACFLRARHVAKTGYITLEMRRDV